MTEINTNQAMSDFLEQTGNFHDAFIRECGLIARGFVDSTYRLHRDTEPFDARVFLQTQACEMPGIEIEFEGVTRFCIGYPFDLRPNGSVANGEVRFSFTTDGDTEPQVIAAAMRYRLLDGACLGESRLQSAARFPDLRRP